MGRAAEAVGAAFGGADGERDAVGGMGDDGDVAPVFAAAKDEVCAEGKCGERERLPLGQARRFVCRE